MKQNTFFILLGVLLIIYGVFGLCTTDNKPKEKKFIQVASPFKPLYNIRVDPKDYGFIIYNINEDRYDTISRGQLETYIMNDNL